jgi:DNA-binding transcriptional regulator LsrR (DeoR family)
MTGLLKALGVDLDILVSQKAVGDISYNLFDDKGQGRPEWQFFITAGHGSKHTGVDFYRHLVEQGRKVIVMAGIRKEAALRVGLNARLFNVLITDVHTTQRLLASN